MNLISFLFLGKEFIQHHKKQLSYLWRNFQHISCGSFYAVKTVLLRTSIFERIFLSQLHSTTCWWFIRLLATLLFSNPTISSIWFIPRRFILSDALTRRVGNSRNLVVCIKWSLILPKLHFYVIKQKQQQCTNERNQNIVEIHSWSVQMRKHKSQVAVMVLHWNLFTTGYGLSLLNISVTWKLCFDMNSVISRDHTKQRK